MNYTKMKSGLKKGIVGVCILGATLLFTTPLSAQTNGKSGKGLYELFSTKLPDGAQWVKDNKYVRKGGYSKKAENYIYVGAAKSPAEMTGLSIPIRENPGLGEYRYITFAWVKWGGEQIGMKFHVSEKSASQKGKKYDFTYIAGEPKDLINQLKGLDLGDKPGHWMVMTRDLWKDFGNITLTGISFICPEKRDAGFDEIFLAKTQDDIKNAPKVLPSEVATVVPAVEEDDELMYDEAASDSIAADQGVQIDWGAQIKAGGTMMYPLYLLGLIALVIAIQRLITSRQGRLAPKPLCKSVNECLANGDLKGALAACDKYPSTLANSLRFIFEHVKAGREAVSQTAGDMAARDIRTHLARIYPLSVIASLAPLIGLLGTVVGMIEAFGLVALYGDEGGASILSDSISKALITTAAGLIIAAPAIALYFIIKNRIMRMASLVEVKVEEVITKLYLDNKEEKNETEL
ncbi:MotA/TolQ/ExbB proton channel family protein [Bacteroides xylanisolvens]|uniref:MotA/TolQ/ExbB proton channel family protein n=1 Tax=Bacteroides xylanisolvens TaxID=371601 RepID=UPI001C377DF8|nr:MotA/TolQ/ExbB proton channel family protein [Bacteroides xylanisolvens]MBV3840319.1 MotA/TolQ/ExbB proton channel family protein [Bacteroides xylanisolvens]